MDFQQLGRRFGIQKPFARFEELSSGNINRTYEVVFGTGEQEELYIFQRLNTYVFQQPEAVMHNIHHVTEHIKQKLLDRHGCYDRRVLSFLTAEDGNPYLYTDNGEFWRAYQFVGGAVAYDVIRDPDQFYEAGRIFGEFQGLLADFPAATLYEIIPDFHHTAKRMEDFARCVQADPVSRRERAEEEIRYLLDRREEAGRLSRLLEAGELPCRVTHNDTKISNVLFDACSGKALCVIDLDTVMPGASAYDFGDAVRSGAATAREDEEDLSAVSFSLPLFEAFTKGYLQETSGLLTSREIDLLPQGAYVITLELASRFLLDYLNGDVYFKITRPDHNLIRARNQLRLARDIEAKLPDMEKIVRRYR